jgi:hypothetical protein
MFKSKWNLIPLVLAIMLVAALGTGSIISAEEKPQEELNCDGSNFVHANSEQLDLIEELHGKAISAGEFLETVYPDQLAEMPDDLVTALFNTPMTWPEKPLTPRAQSDHPLTTQTQSTNSEVCDSIVVGSDRPLTTETQSASSETRDTIVVSHSLWLPSATTGSGEIEYRAKSEVTVPWHKRIPYIWVSPVLYRDLGDTLELCDSSSSWDTNAHTVDTDDISYDTDTDGYYFSYANYMGTYPSGYNPPAYSTYLQSTNVYLAP